MKEFYIHTKCCNGHWELKYLNGKYELVCEACGKPAGSGITVSGPNLSKHSCAACSNRRS